MRVVLDMQPCRQIVSGITIGGRCVCTAFTLCPGDATSVSRRPHAGAAGSKSDFKEGCKRGFHLYGHLFNWMRVMRVIPAVAFACTVASLLTHGDVAHRRVLVSHIIAFGVMPPHRCR